MKYEQFENIKTIIQTKIRNFHIKTDEPLFLATNASQISCGYILFQLTKQGTLKLVKCNSRLLRQSSRNKGSSKRELISLSFALVENEGIIRNHEHSVLMLSDASSLQLIQRGKTTNTIFAELGCYISSFPNLGVYYWINKCTFPS